MKDILFGNNNSNAIKAISRKSFKSNKTRNIVAIIAIFLMTLLFTSVFTVAGVMLHAVQQQNFRQAGSYAHGSLKDLLFEDVKILSTHPLINKYGLKKMLGFMGNNEFAKNPTEVNYCDETYAKLTYIEFIKGGLPRENTMEMACNTKVLEALGIEPKIGTKITLTYEIDRNVTITDTFILSGYWQSEHVNDVSYVYLPLSYVNKTLAENPPAQEYAWSGKLDMNIYLRSDVAIHDTILTILKEGGFQNSDPKVENYRGVGINWAYISAQAIANIDISVILSVIILLFLFLCSGYLTVFNIFHISVSNDIHFYGLLKTIGTTSRQIRKIIYDQALLLCIIGIPLGLLGGFTVGHIIAPIIMQTLNIGQAELTIHPYIFIGGTLFTLVTVFISCKKPAKTAGRVSPVEAVRYTEIANLKKNRRTSRKTNLIHMAFANIARNKLKTGIIVLSLSLSILVLQMTVSFANGLDIHKYLNKFVVSDILLGHVNYLNAMKFFDKDLTLTEKEIQTITGQKGITDFGIVYGTLGNIGTWGTSYAFYSRERLDQVLSDSLEYDTPGAVAAEKKRTEKLGTNENQEVLLSVTMYGMDDFALDNINVLKGTIEDIQAKHGIIAVYSVDHFGNPKIHSNDKNIGDIIRIRHVDEWDYFNFDTDEPIDDIENYEQAYYKVPAKYTDETYEVVALATVNHRMSYRFSGSRIFILPSTSLKNATVNAAPMSLLLDVEHESMMQVENFLEQYTTTINTSLDFESKQRFTNDFYKFKHSHLMIGILLSSVTGLIGTLNFFNVILTSITVRKREFAMLQSIGMTGKQLKTMLISEGLIYIALTMFVALLLTVTTSSMFETVVSSMFWYFSSYFTIIPLIIVLPFLIAIGIFTPILIYEIINKQSIIERLREVT